MSRLADIILEGEVLHEEREAAECRRVEIQDAFAIYGDRRRAERETRIARGWNRAMAAVMSEAADAADIAAGWDRVMGAVASEAAPDEESDDERHKRLPRYGPHPKKLEPRRGRDRGRWSHGNQRRGSAAESWDEALDAVATGAPGAEPPPAQTGAEARWDVALQDAAAPNGSISAHVLTRTGQALARLWCSMFS